MIGTRKTKHTTCDCGSASSSGGALPHEKGTKLMDTRTGSFGHNLGPGWAFLLAACAAASIAAAAAPAETASNTVATAAAAAAPAVDLVQKWGIQVSGLFLSAGGNMVDFRYKVLDPKKAAILTRPDIKPTLLNLTSGAKLIVPDSDVGPLRQSSRPQVAGKLYFILFANTRHHVKSGDKVTISAGDFTVENLTVE